MRIFCTAKDSHIFSTKNHIIFVIFTFEILTKTLTNDVVNFERLGPGVQNYIDPIIVAAILED